MDKFYFDLVGALAASDLIGHDLRERRGNARAWTVHYPSHRHGKAAGGASGQLHLRTR
jgi:hypothetical protein